MVTWFDCHVLKIILCGEYLERREDGSRTQAGVKVSGVGNRKKRMDVRKMAKENRWI